LEQTDASGDHGANVTPPISGDRGGDVSPPTTSKDPLPPVPALVGGTCAPDISKSTVEPSVVPDPPVVPRSQYHSPVSAATDAPETSSSAVEPSEGPDQPTLTDSEPISGPNGLTVAPSTSVSFDDLMPVPQATNRQNKPNVSQGNEKVEDVCLTVRLAKWRRSKKINSSSKKPTQISTTST